MNENIRKHNLQVLAASLLDRSRQSRTVDVQALATYWSRIESFPVGLVPKVRNLLWQLDDEALKAIVDGRIRFLSGMARNVLVGRDSPLLSD